MNIPSDFLQLIFTILALLLAITVHEFMHAWVANYLGDPTPRRAGRITLNPLAHLDPIGTLMMFLVRIGWGKPVPINPNNFNNPRLGSALTSVAGPISNLVLAIFLALIFNIPGVSHTIFGQFLVTAIVLNLFLMVFNLLPIPPLDGSKFFALFFPVLDSSHFGAYGFVLLLAFVFLGGTSLLLPIVNFLLNILGVQYNLL